MGLHERECPRDDVERTRERNSRLVEYARKVYQERQDAFSQLDSPPLARLHLSEQNAAGESGVLHIAFPFRSTNVRQATVVLEVDSLTSSEYALYTVSMGKRPIKCTVRDGDETVYETDAPADQDVLALAFESQLESMSGVEAPQTSYTEERQFWQIALEACVEDMPHHARAEIERHMGAHSVLRSYEEFMQAISTGSQVVGDVLYAHAAMSSFGGHYATKQELEAWYLSHFTRADFRQRQIGA